jgi:hypothetical protein
VDSSWSGMVVGKKGCGKSDVKSGDNIGVDELANDLTITDTMRVLESVVLRGMLCRGTQ